MSLWWACTCSPYFGCSEYAPDCPRHGTAIPHEVGEAPDA